MAGQRTAKKSSITWIGLTLNTWYTLAEAFAPLLGPTGEILLPYSMSPNGLAADLGVRINVHTVPDFKLANDKNIRDGRGHDSYTGRDSGSLERLDATAGPGSYSQW